ncbi:CNH domain-containing protein [Flagelloscypha sp. PMI_526]|nr:CNH domain-containing protein [Flagelloscypha sp. PMI_526]
MNLLDENRSLIFAGRLMGCLEEGLEWRELFVLLFDNYLVITKPVDKNEVTMYKVKRRPIPLDLLTIIRINDPPTRSYIFSYSPSTTTSSTPSSDSSCLVYPFTFYQSGRSSRKHTLFAESEAARAEWTKRLAAALDLRKDFQAANKVLAIKTLSINTFLLLDVKKEAEGSVYGTGLVRQLSDAACYTGKVNCSVLFNTADGRWLIAIGTEEGLWIGFKRDPKSLRRVAHMRKITQCAVLEDFGIFLILTDKALVAYPVQSFVPSTLQTPQVSQAPQKLNGTKDVCFFRVGKVKGRVVVIFVHNKPSGSDFTLLEPVKSTNMDGKEQPTGFRSWLGFKSTASDWFKRYKNFSLSIEAFDLIFMKGKIVVLYAKGFEIMDLDGLDGMTVPQIHYPSSKHLKNRCEQCRPIAIYCSTPDMYLLCYDGNIFPIFFSYDWTHNCS